MPFIITNSFKPDINREYPPSLHAPSNPFNYNLTDTGRKWVVNLIRRAQYGARPMKLPPFPRKGKAGGKKMRNTSQTWKALDHIPSIPLTHPPAVLLPWRLRAKLVTNFSRAEIKGGSRGRGIYIQRNIRSHDRPFPPFLDCDQEEGQFITRGNCQIDLLIRVLQPEIALGYSFPGLCFRRSLQRPERFRRCYISV